MSVNIIRRSSHSGETDTAIDTRKKIIRKDGTLLRYGGYPRGDTGRW